MSSWTCSVCTYVNVGPLASACAMCESPPQTAIIGTNSKSTNPHALAWERARQEAADAELAKRLMEEEEAADGDGSNGSGGGGVTGAAATVNNNKRKAVREKNETNQHRTSNMDEDVEEDEDDDGAPRRRRRRLVNSIPHDPTSSRATPAAPVAVAVARSKSTTRSTNEPTKPASASSSRSQPSLAHVGTNQNRPSSSSTENSKPRSVTPAAATTTKLSRSQSTITSTSQPQPPTTTAPSSAPASASTSAHIASTRPNLARAATHQQRSNTAAAASSAASPSPPSNVDVDWVYAAEGTLPIDHSPLHALALASRPVPTCFRSSDLSRMFQRGFTGSLSEGTFKCMLQSEYDVTSYIELLWRITDLHSSHAGITLPPETIRSCWLGILSSEVSLRSGQECVESLIQIQSRTPWSFVTKEDDWNRWQRECLSFSRWLQKKERLAKSGKLEQLASDVEKNDLNSLHVPAASSSSSSQQTSFTSTFDQRTALIAAQDRIASELRQQVSEEKYYAKWCLQIDILLRAFAIDADVRMHGLEPYSRVWSDVDGVRESNPKRQDASRESCCLLLRLIYESPPILSFERTFESEEILEKEVGPNLRTREEEEEEEDEKQRQGGDSKKTKKKKRISRQSYEKRAKEERAAGRATIDAIHAADATLLADAEEESDPIERDDSFLSWWMSLLPMLGLQSSSSSSSTQPQVDLDNRRAIATFRSKQCLHIYQHRVLEMVTILQRFQREKMRLAMKEEEE